LDGQQCHPNTAAATGQGPLEASADKDKDFFDNKIEKLTGMKFTEVCQLISTSFGIMMITMIA